MIAIKLLFNILFVFISYRDIKERILPESYLILMLIVSLIKNFQNFNLFNLYLSMSIFTFPIFIQILIEFYIKKEIIGLGDIKLFTILSIYFCRTDLIFVYKFYTSLYIIGAIIVLIFRRIKGYFPFAPIIYLTYIIGEFLL